MWYLRTAYHSAYLKIVALFVLVWLHENKYTRNDIELPNAGQCVREVFYDKTISNRTDDSQAMSAGYEMYILSMKILCIM